MRDLSQENREEIKKVFRECLSVEEDAKELTSSASNLRKHLAESLEIPKKEINKAYSTWKFFSQKPETAENVDNLIEQIL